MLLYSTDKQLQGPLPPAGLTQGLLGAPSNAEFTLSCHNLTDYDHPYSATNLIGMTGSKHVSLLRALAMYICHHPMH